MTIFSSEVKTYNAGADSTLPTVTKKRKFDDDAEDEETSKSKRVKEEVKEEDEGRHSRVTD